MKYETKRFFNIFIGMLMTVMLLFGFCMMDIEGNVPRVGAEEKSLLINLNSAGEDTAKRIHKALQKEQPVILKIGKNVTDSKKIVEALQKQVGKENKQGVIFQCRLKDSGTNSCQWEISSKDARLYNYSVNFVKKLFVQTKNNICKNFVDGSYDNKTLRLLERAKSLYPDPKERERHILYEMLLFKRYSRDWVSDSEYDYTTICTKENEDEIGFPDFVVCDTDYALLEKCIIREDGEKYNDYEAFVKKAGQDKIDNVKDLYRVFPYKQQLKLLLETENFCELSDAMKVLAIHMSGYFSSHRVWTIYDDFQVDYLMEYSYSRRSYTGVAWRDMKTLYEGKAVGVCANFAVYECLLFDQLAISNSYQSNEKINHAWSVVCVKNSKGKSLWIPFDYGIGPSHELLNKDETMRYVLTSRKRYETYLEGVKGAPKYKNFTDDDFN